MFLSCFEGVRRLLFLHDADGGVERDDDEDDDRFGKPVRLAAARVDEIQDERKRPPR